MALTGFVGLGAGFALVAVFFDAAALAAGFFATGLCFAVFFVVLFATRVIPNRMRPKRQHTCSYYKEAEASFVREAPEPLKLAPAFLGCLAFVPFCGPLPLGLEFRHIAQLPGGKKESGLGILGIGAL